MSSSETTAPLELQKVLKSLEWVDGVIWDLTGLPDAFVSLLMHCSEILRDAANAHAHLGAAFELLDIAEPAKSKYDAEGPDVLRSAIKLAVDDRVFASNLASLCDTYYFLRSLEIFSLDKQSFDKLVGLLKLDDAALEDASAYSHTHTEVIDSLNAYLGQLEAKYPGIKLFANCVMLEANIMQEFGTNFEQLFALRSILPQDGELYMATLRSVVDSLHENLDAAGMIANVRYLYEDAEPEYWEAVSNAIWELQNGPDADNDMLCDDDYEIHYSEDLHFQPANIPDSSASRVMGMVAN
ncbi:hypothetical protein LPJ64_006099 [Coemansia asiatica]|uniref:Uncharacterized protein n=1 Tax=Coemansia asiatica TaxID=1052880 RepID=A0A9W8CGC2_9FUNG|nr:hypothetical protein LPJ64_006099 [Coemansia asiatica]KAJ2880063.1 hypothetical protein FB639_002922 [Coemansia asiatica]